MEKKFVYWDKNNFCFYTVPKQFTNNPEETIKYLGDGRLDNNDELIIYELVPVKTLKKTKKYEFK